jgi:hypothetical protein
MRTDGRTDGDMAKLTVAFRNFTNAPKTLKMAKKCSTPQYTMVLETVRTIKRKTVKSYAFYGRCMIELRALIQLTLISIVLNQFCIYVHLSQRQRSRNISH